MEGKTGRTKGKENTCRTVGITKAPCGQWTFRRPQGLLLFLCIEIRIFDRNKKSERLSYSESVRIIRMWSE